MNNDYKKAQFKKMVAEADLNLSLSDCPLIEDEALVWADKEMLDLRMYNKQLLADLKKGYERIERLEYALNHAIVAMHAPWDRWKDELEGVALNRAMDALK